MVRFHYRLRAVEKRLSGTIDDHCFGFTLRSYTYIPNMATAHLHYKCLSYAYKVII